MNSDTAKIKANKAWETLIAKSSYLLMSSRELESVKTFYSRILYSNYGF